MIEVEEGSVEGRILRILLELYPATWREVEREVGVPPMAFKRALAILQRRGLVGVEGTGERRFLTLLRTDILFHRSGGGKRPRKPVLPKHEYDGSMYG
jgi:predicted ArsR family transcriptional regulator